MPSSSHNRVVLDFKNVKKRLYTDYWVRKRKIALSTADLGTLRALQLQSSQ